MDHKLTFPNRLQYRLGLARRQRRELWGPSNVLCMSNLCNSHTVASEGHRLAPQDCPPHHLVRSQRRRDASLSSIRTLAPLLPFVRSLNSRLLKPHAQLTIAEFKANLHSLMNLVKSPDSPYYSPTTKFLLITPPPVDAFIRNAELAAREPPRVPDRDSERTRLFAEAVKEVGMESGVAVVDCWTAITDAAADDGGLDKYLADGLHLTAAGYKVVTMGKSVLTPRAFSCGANAFVSLRAGIAAAITQRLPELHWDRLEQIFPHWADIGESLTARPSNVRSILTCSNSPPS
jgi:hypothetical protein